MATSPPSGAENAGIKVHKDRSCPFCGQAFTSSSLGRHLDLYIKSKNPKPPDGVHDVDEIRKLRGNITRRQSRVASIRRDSSTPAGPASARYLFDDKGAPAPDSLRRVNWSVNKPGWEVTGVMNDLPPRIEPRPTDRRDSTKRDQMKADLDQRQRLADELDTGRAAQLALREILDTVRNAEASATGRHLFDDFDFFQQSFPNLCLRLLSPSPPLDSPLSISASDSWSSNIPWDQQRDALSRAVEERGQLLRQRSGLQSPAFEDASANNLNLERFHKHITHVFDLWANLSESGRQDIWQREILRSYVRIEKELKEAQSTIRSLKREVEHFALRLDRMNSTFSPYQTGSQSRHQSLSVPPSPVGIPDEILGDLFKQGVNVREWDYERLVDRWKNVVRDERRASSGLSAQRSFSTSSQQTRVTNIAGNLSANGGPDSTASRSASITSAMSAAAPTRTSSMDSATLDADAEGEEEEDIDGDNIAPDAQPYTRPSHSQPAAQPGLQANHSLEGQPQALQRLPPLDPRTISAARQPQSHIDHDYKWPQAHGDESTPTPYSILPNPSTIKKIPPGPDSWRNELQHAAGHTMEGLEGPAVTNAPTTVG